MAHMANAVQARLTTVRLTSPRPALERAIILSDMFSNIKPETYVLPETTQLFGSKSPIPDTHVIGSFTDPALGRI